VLDFVRMRTHQHQSSSLSDSLSRDIGILGTLARLQKKDAVYEVRFFTPRGVVSGYFNNPFKLKSEVMKWDGKVQGIFTTLNPVYPALLARADNRLIVGAKQTTSDSDIVRRRWLPVDCDPKRPSGISSTDVEHEAALARARAIQAWFLSQGFPADSIILADSGNGAHVLVRIDLPNNEASTQLVKKCIEAVAFRFSDDTVVVDLSVYNAARIWKLYGTQVCKGDPTSDRPHRVARILED
jgi:hypothetical protein